MDTDKKKKKKRPPPKKEPTKKEVVGIDLSKELPGADDDKYVSAQSKKITAKEVKKHAKKLFDEINGELEDGSVASPTGYDWLRRLAELTYVTSQGPISIKKIAELPEFKGKIHPITLNKYCNVYNWVEKRAKYFNGLQEKIKNQVATAQIQSRVEQLKTFDKIFEQLLSRLPESEPNSMEGVVSALVKVGKFSEELRTLVANEIVPEKNSIANDHGVTSVTPQLSTDEARAAAMAVVKMRKDAAANNKQVDSAPEEPE